MNNDGSEKLVNKRSKYIFLICAHRSIEGVVVVGICSGFPFMGSWSAGVEGDASTTVALNDIPSGLDLLAKERGLFFGMPDNDLT
jgi:hypothetical protein